MSGRSSSRPPCFSDVANFSPNPAVITCAVISGPLTLPPSSGAKIVFTSSQQGRGSSPNPLLIKSFGRWARRFSPVHLPGPQLRYQASVASFGPRTYCSSTTSTISTTPSLPLEARSPQSVSLPTLHSIQTIPLTAGQTRAQYSNPATASLITL